ncbi:MAG: cytochrome c [Gemmatimonadetes bacterium]|nr:cytochrome c [Gemmatimonadota bacterium]
MLGGSLAAAGCDGGATAGASGTGGERAATAGAASGAATGATPVRFADYDGGAVPGGPGAGRHYGIGIRATAAAITKMDRDIGPDGAELPAGTGSVAEGGALYKAQCAMCHGVNGEGMAPAFPRLSGRDPAAEGFKFASDPKLPHTIGNYWSHATTLFDYIRRAMPHVAPGSLTDDQVYALTAYLLAKDDVIAKDATLDAAALRAVKMPYADRFVPDDRRPNAPK